MQDGQEEGKEVSEIQNNDLIEVLESKSLITDSVCKTLMEAKDFIASTYTDVPMYRPLPVKLFGVLNDKSFPTAEAKWWQCKVEAETHANELIRDIHDFELAKIELDKSKLILKRMESRRNSKGHTQEDVEMVDLDIREQKVYLSRKRFEIKQVEKRIRYRIEEVTEWKKISDELMRMHGQDIVKENYVQHYVNKLKHSISQKLNASEDAEEKKNLQQQLNFIDKAVRNFS